MPPPPPPPARRPRKGARRALAVAASLGLHLGGLAALLTLRPAPARPAEPRPMTVALVDAPPTPAPAPAPAAAPARAAPTRAAPAPPRAAARPAPAPKDVPAPPAVSARAAATGNEVGEAELAGAAGAGSGEGAGGGGGGGACDMARRLQDALAKDALVRAALGAPGGPRAGHALRVWDGDWTANPGEDGRGLAAVREAIMWEVGFSPKACREAAVRGLVLISLADLPGAPRLVLGTARWRWSDLLTPRTGGAAPAAAER